MQTLFGYEDDEEQPKPTYEIYSKDDIAEAAFNYFREVGFPYRDLPVHICMQQINRLAAMPLDDRLLMHQACYQVADTYHPHRFEANAFKMTSPVDSFANDKRLRRALTRALDDGMEIPAGLFNYLLLVTGTQACSNFRPAFASYIYRTYARAGDVVLDTSTGYGGRLVGFLAAKLNGLYIGIDPNVETWRGNSRLAEDMGAKDQVELWAIPAEDMKHHDLENRCDFAFTSPPYFKKEIYSHDDAQSWKRYETAEEWRDKFLYKMLELQYAALKPNTTSIVNIAPVRIGKDVYPLDEWAKDAGEAAGFTYVETRRFALQKRMNRTENDRSFEPIIVFTKGV